jgi:hypothetical protein
MAGESSFLLILENGAASFLAAASPNDARHHASFADGHGWVFRCEFNGYASERHRRSGPVKTLWLISALGRPNSDVMIAALNIAGEQHRVLYMFARLEGE